MQVHSLGNLKLNKEELLQIDEVGETTALKVYQHFCEEEFIHSGQIGEGRLQFKVNEGDHSKGR